MDSSALCFLEGFALVRRASLLDRVLNRREGYRFLGWGSRMGWSGEMPLYAKENRVEYPEGYNGKLSV